MNGDSSELWIGALADMLVHSFWQGGVVAAMLWLSLVICPRNRPSLRCGLSLLALAFLTAWMGMTFAGGLYADPIGKPAALPGTANVEAVAVHQLSRSENDVSQASSTQQRWMLIAWATGAIGFGLRLAFGWLVLGRIRREAAVVIDQDCIKLFESVRFRLGLRRRVILKTSELIDSPLTFGWLKPVVLVPAALLTAMPVAHLEAVFAHELMHVRRADFLINLLVSLLRALLFFNPAVWWMEKCIRIEREAACDLGSSDGLRRSAHHYAAALLALDEWRAHQRDLVAGNQRPTPFALAMIKATNGGLVERVERVVASSSREVSHAPIRRGTVVMVLLSLTLLVAGIGWRLGGGSIEGVGREAAGREASYGQRAGSGDSSEAGVAAIAEAELGLRKIRVAMEMLERPPHWSNAGHRLMRSRLVLEIDGVAHPFGSNDPPVFGKIANAWILEHGLNYRDAGLQWRDPDGDGFSNAEEFAAATSPADASSHPPLIGKLSFVERKQRVYRVVFAAQPDAKTFQLNRLPSARWGRATFLMPAPGSSDDGQLEILAWNGDELLLKHRPTEAVQAVKKGAAAEFATDFAVLRLDIGEPESFIVRVGESFPLGEDSERWTLESVTENSARLRSPGADVPVTVIDSRKPR